MKQLPLFCLAILLGFAASAPAQTDVSRVGRQVRGTHVLGAVRGHDHRPQVVPLRRVSQRCGRWETICEQILVPGYWHEEHVPPTYGWICDPCGHRYWGIVDAGGCRRVWVPARWETRSRRVWVNH